MPRVHRHFLPGQFWQRHSPRVSQCRTDVIQTTGSSMADIINARVPPRVEEKLSEYCAKRGVTRTEAVVRALDHYLDHESGGASPYSLASDLIPPKGVKELQSDNVRELARKAFRGPRSR